MGWRDYFGPRFNGAGTNGSDQPPPVKWMNYDDMPGYYSRSNRFPKH